MFRRIRLGSATGWQKKKARLGRQALKRAGKVKTRVGLTASGSAEESGQPRWRCYEACAKMTRYFFATSAEALVFSQSIRRVQPLADLSRAMVKFSTAAEVAETFIGIRARSSEGPG